MTAHLRRLPRCVVALAALVGAAGCETERIIEPEPVPVALRHWGHFDLTRLGEGESPSSVRGGRQDIELAGQIHVPDLCRTFFAESVALRDTVTVTVVAQRRTEPGPCVTGDHPVPYWIDVEPPNLGAFVVKVSHVRRTTTGAEEARHDFAPVPVRVPSAD